MFYRKSDNPKNLGISKASLYILIEKKISFTFLFQYLDVSNAVFWTASTQKNCAYDRMYG